MVKRRVQKRRDTRKIDEIVRVNRRLAGAHDRIAKELARYGQCIRGATSREVRSFLRHSDYIDVLNAAGI